MGRAGAGSGGGGSHISGGHSHTRVSGGHRVGGSSHHRAGSGSSSFSSFGSNSFSSFGSSSMGSYNNHYSNSNNNYRHTHIGNTNLNMNTYQYGGTGDDYVRMREREAQYRDSSTVVTNSNPILTIFIAIAIIACIIVFFALGDSASIPKSTVNRTKLDNPIAYNPDCIIDEIGWFDNITLTGKYLKTFYNKTGIQPYIVLKAYDANLVTDSAKESYAQEWFTNNIHDENTFLFMYFAEKDTDNEVGFMCYVNGFQVNTVMDKEAVDIFWGYIDSNWVTDKSTDEVFIDSFNNTATRIMTRTKTGADILLTLVLFVGIIVIIALVVIGMKAKFKRDKEEAEETERILNTPLQTYADNEASDLVDKYTNTSQKIDTSIDFEDEI